MTTMTGERVKEHLRAMPEGDVIWVGRTLWCSLGTTFEVEDARRHTYVDAKDLDREFHDANTYEVLR